MSAWVYVNSEPSLWTVGFYDPKGRWHADLDHATKQQAAKRCAYLNGGSAVNRTLDEALNTNDR